MTDEPDTSAEDEEVEPLELPNSLKRAHIANWEDHFMLAYPPAWQKRAANDPEYAKELASAQRVIAELVRYEAFRLIFDPPRRPVFQRGKQVGWEEKRADPKHVQWMLERIDPESFHLATKFELSGHSAPNAFKFQMGEVHELEAGDTPENDS